MSPVSSQPSMKALAVFSGLFQYPLVTDWPLTSRRPGAPPQPAALQRGRCRLATADAPAQPEEVAPRRHPGREQRGIEGGYGGEHGGGAAPKYLGDGQRRRPAIVGGGRGAEAQGGGE